MTVVCVKITQNPDPQVYRAFCQIFTLDLRDKIYHGILGVLAFRLFFPPYFFQKGGIYGNFSIFGLQNIDYNIVLRYNFRGSQN